MLSSIAYMWKDASTESIEASSTRYFLHTRVAVFLACTLGFVVGGSFTGVVWGDRQDIWVIVPVFWLVVLLMANFSSGATQINIGREGVCVRSLMGHMVISWSEISEIWMYTYEMPTSAIGRQWLFVCGHKKMLISETLFLRYGDELQDVIHFWMKDVNILKSDKLLGDFGFFGLGYLLTFRALPKVLLWSIFYTTTTAGLLCAIKAVSCTAIQWAWGQIPMGSLIILGLVLGLHNAVVVALYLKKRASLKCS